jgi:hypothetical protein
MATVSAGYVGTRGRDLPQIDVTRAIIEPGDEIFENFDILQVAFNGGRSDYHGIQLALRGRMHPNFHSQVSYTWGHSIDNDPYNVVEPGFSTFGFADLDAPIVGERTGDSDFDIRHALRFSGSFSPPAPQSGIAAKLLGDWWIDWMGTARTATPVKVQGVTRLTSDQEELDEPPFGLYALIQPHTTGEQIWLDDSGAPGGRRINPDAFALPEDFLQGVLGRNSVRGFARFQVDLAVRRRIAINERFHVDVAGQAINVLNHPGFANPTADGTAHFASPQFGFATDMPGQAGGQGGSPRYRMGGPRSLQFSLRLGF